jgi:restriction endonuclease S subunit
MIKLNKVKLEDVCIVAWGNSELTKSSYVEDGSYLAVSAAGCDGRIGHREHSKHTPVISAIGANCGRMFLPNEDFTAIKNTITITPKSNLTDGRYLYEVLTFLELPKRGGAQPFMSKGDIEKFKIPLPDLAEQRKIAEILRTWDEAIETAEAIKVKLFSDFKRGIIRQIIPIRNEIVPSRRFPEFFNSDKWEERNVGEVFKVTRGKVLSMSLVSELKTVLAPYPVYSSQTLRKGLAGFFNEFLHSDAITWTTDGANAGEVNYRHGKFYCTNVCGVLSDKNGHANSCIATLLNGVTKSYVSYVGNPKLMSAVMASIKVPFSSVQEERRISEFIDFIDELIDIQQSRIDQLRVQKRGLMQKLLTGEVRVAA